MLRGLPHGSLQKFVEQGLVRLALARCEAAQFGEEPGINADRMEVGIEVGWQEGAGYYFSPSG